MDRDGYYQPDTCVKGNNYYLRAGESDAKNDFKVVKFVNYRPHPAEVVIKDGNRSRVIRRIDLYQKNGQEQTENQPLDD